jgi:hypothetical protein
MKTDIFILPGQLMASRRCEGGRRIGQAQRRPTNVWEKIGGSTLRLTLPTILQIFCFPNSLDRLVLRTKSKNLKFFIGIWPPLLLFWRSLWSR